MYDWKADIVIVTGGFDPLHMGHIEYIDAAACLGDILIVGLNSDAWLERKKGKAFMSFEDRKAIVQNLTQVYDIVAFADDDGSANDAIQQIKEKYPAANIIFANGGDRNSGNTPEQKKYGKDPQVTFKFEVGGTTKANSSSWIIDAWQDKTDRPWGHWRVLKDSPGTKVKELVVDPGKDLSMQRHFKRHELWFVAEGSCTVYFENGSKNLNKHDYYHIPISKWHRLTNPTDAPCKIIEIQYGTDCTEEDIERL